MLVDYEPGVVRLEITDDGRGVNGRATNGGHGLVGMRERVAVYGGALEAAPRRRRLRDPRHASLRSA